MKKNGDISIFKHGDGSYELFNKFIIVEHNPNIYSVRAANESTMVDFASLKTAVSWCILMGRNRLDKANRVAQLDEMLMELNTSIDHHRQMIKRSTNLDLTMIYLAKLSEEQSKKRHLTKELVTHINTSKYWQLQQFIKGRNTSTMINTR